MASAKGKADNGNGEGNDDQWAAGWAAKEIPNAHCCAAGVSHGA